MSPPNRDLNKVKKWINVNLTEEDWQKMENTDGDKKGRYIVLEEMAKNCLKSGVKVKKQIIRKEITIHYINYKLVKAPTPYTAQKRDTKGKFTVKGATYGVQTFPLVGAQLQANVIDSFLLEYRQPMEVAAGVVDSDQLMGTTRTVWLRFANGELNELIQAGDVQKFTNLIKFCSERLSELLHQTNTEPKNCFVNFYDSRDAHANTHRDTTSIGSTVLVLQSTATSTLDISLQADLSETEMEWKGIDMEQGDILAMRPNITHKYTGTDDQRMALVCFF
jgi:hypothetical protein